MKSLICFVLFVAIVNAQCNLDCAHGDPNQACNACNCIGGWTMGPSSKCDQWNATATYDDLVGQLLALAYASESKAPDFKGTLLPLQSSLGNGLDITSGNLKLPLLKLDYSSGNTFTLNNSLTFLIANNQQATSFPFNTNAVNDTVIFEGMFDYIQFLYNISRDDQKVPFQTLSSGMSDLSNFQMKYFSGNSAITCSKWKMPMFDTHLTASIDSYQLEPRAKAALLFLPPDYSSPTNKALYRTFVNFWGTHVVTHSMGGGQIELESFFQKSILNRYGGVLDEAIVGQQAMLEFQKNTFGSNSGQQLLQDYVNNRQLGVLGCLGGNAAELCSMQQLQLWKESVPQNPFAYEFGVSDLSVLMPEPIRSNIKQAIADYLTEVHTKWSINYPFCSKCFWGTCSDDGLSCVCNNPRITGATCDKCRVGYSGDQCWDAVCDRINCEMRGAYCTGPNRCSCGEIPYVYSSSMYSDYERLPYCNQRMAIN